MQKCLETSQIHLSKPSLELSFIFYGYYRHACGHIVCISASCYHFETVGANVIPIFFLWFHSFSLLLTLIIIRFCHVIVLGDITRICALNSFYNF